MGSEEREIQVTFTAKSYFELDEGNITIKPNHPKVKKVSIMSADQKAKIVVYTTYLDVDTAIEQANSIVDEINNIIIYEYDQGLEEIELSGAYQSAENVMQLHSFITTEMTVRTEVIRHIKDLNKFEEMINTKLTGHENIRLNIYANISKMESSIARFIMYYSMLHDLYSNQKSVDEFIIQEIPEVKKVQTERPGKDFYETIYTYIRNQISHLNKGTNIEWVKKQVDSNLSRLQQLTKRAIKRNT